MVVRIPLKNVRNRKAKKSPAPRKGTPGGVKNVKPRKNIKGSK